MRKGLLLAASFFLAVSAIPARGQSLPTIEQGTAFLRKAIEATNLKGLAAPPFHLVAQVHYELDAAAGDGKYEILWASPDRYRVEFRLGQLAETNIALGDKFYIGRSTPTLSFPMWSLGNFLWAPGEIYLGPAPAGSRVYSAQMNGETQMCIDVHSDKVVEKQVCFDPGTNEVVSIRVKAQMPKRTRANIGFENQLENFVSLGPIRYPRHMVKRFFSESIDVRVEKFERVTQFAESVFVPPADAEARNWCVSPVRQGDPEISSPSLPSNGLSGKGVSGLSSFIAYYVLIGSDGKVRKLAKLHSSDNPMGDEAIAALDRNITDSDRLCGGKPIEREEIRLSFPLGN